MAAYCRLAALSAYDMVYWYKYLSVKWEFLSDHFLIIAYVYLSVILRSGTALWLSSKSIGYLS